MFPLGTIELKEMSEIIETLYEMEGVSKVGILFNLKTCFQKWNEQSSKINAFLGSQLDIYSNLMSKFWLQLNAGEKAAMIFSDLDIDGNGTVDEEEFIRWWWY